MKLWNTNVCLTNRVCVLFIVGTLFSTLIIASVWPSVSVIDEDISEMWIPTPDDIAYQDSMYIIIKNTQNDITDIKEDIVLIIERLDYADGSYDSIRYVKGGKIDKRRNQ